MSIAAIKVLEFLAERFMKKTIQTAAMKLEIDNEENAATNYPDITRLNVFSMWHYC